MQLTTVLPQQTKPANVAGWKRGGEIFMNDTKNEKMLEKQLQMLSEHAKDASNEILRQLTEAMAHVAKLLNTV